MALRLRRGTNAERTTITFAEGELIYVTDHVAESVAPLWVGDGVTLGGRTADTHIAGTIGALQDVNITGITNDQVLKWVAANERFEPVDISQLNQGATQLDDLTDVDLTTVPPHLFNANVLKYNGLQFVPVRLTLEDIEDFINTANSKSNDILMYDGVHYVPTASDKIFKEQQNYKINIAGDDSTIIIDTDTNNVTGNFFGDVTGNLTGNVIGTVFGRLDGDVTGSIFADDSALIIDGVSGNVHANTILTTSRISISNENNLPTSVVITSDDNPSDLQFIKNSDGDLSANVEQYGLIEFTRNDVNGLKTTAQIYGGGNGYFYFSANGNGLPATESSTLTWIGDQLGVGTYTPAQELDVRGNAVVTGFVQFGSLSYLQRDALAAAAGMVIWNSDSLQFEGFNGTNWINLIDGAVSTAP